jgi:ribosome recycling factor
MIVSENNFNETKSEITRRMQGAFNVLIKEFGGLRTGRAAPSLLESITVDAYGSDMPMSQVGTVGAPEPRMLTVQVWDKSLTKAVEKAIQDSGLGLNAQSDGQLIRIPIPALTEERRVELSKIASKYSEDARVAVRNVRRHFMDELKKDEKDGKISKDLHHDQGQEIQVMTDDFIKKVDESLDNKEKEIMQV